MWHTSCQILILCIGLWSVIVSSCECSIYYRFLRLCFKTKMKLQSGHDLVHLEGAEKKKQAEDWGGYTDGLVRLTPGRWLFPTGYENFADKLYNFKYKSSDVVVMTWPKCGTTWTQEIVWTMRSNPDLNHPMAKLPVMIRSPFIDMDMMLPIPQPGAPPPKDNPFIDAFKRMCPGKNPADGLNLQMAEVTQDPRTIKTHLPFSLMPPSLLDTTKVVYVARNPKDVIVSYHHHCRLIKLLGYVGSFEDFVQYFLDDDLMYGPYWLHVKEAWELKKHPNLHIIFYEDLKANPLQEIKKLNTFLDTNLTEKQLEGIVKYTSFSEMKARNAASGFKEDEMESFNGDIVRKEGGFYRKGESGSWKAKLTPDLEAKVDQWIKKNMDSFGINFKYGV